MPTPPKPIRLVIQQPALPKYRLPVFEELSRRRGIDLTVVYGEQKTLPNADRFHFKAIKVPLREFTIFGQPVLWHPAQWQYATRAHADVLILNWNVRYPQLVPALLRARAEGVPTILWGHGYSKNEATWRAWPRRKVTELATALLFYNHTTARNYIATGTDPRKVFVALNSLDQRPIQAARQHWLSRPEELAAFRREHNLTGPTIIFVSRLEPANRVDLLLQATQQLLRKFPTLTAVIVGKGPDEQRLKGLAAELGIERHVRFPGAIYDEMQLAPWMLSADVYCYPSNIGLSLLHAFGYALPVVTADRPTAHGPEIEALQPDRNGLVYAEGNIQSLTETLRHLLDCPELRARLSAGAEETVLTQFSLTKMVDGFMDAIQTARAAIRHA